jgi:hypothetical protein
MRDKAAIEARLAEWRKKYAEINARMEELSRLIPAMLVSMDTVCDLREQHARAGGYIAALEFTLEENCNTQPELIHSLDECRKTLVEGGCFLNVGGCTNAHMKPANDAVEDEYRKQHAAAHPRPAARWTA